MFTGYGGDEIMSRAPAERSQPTTPPRLPTWLDQRTRDALAHVDTNCSPVTAVALPTLLVFAARHPAYLRAGLRPIARSPARSCRSSAAPYPSNGGLATLVYDMLALHIGVHSMCTAPHPGKETSCPSSTPNH